MLRVCVAVQMRGAEHAERTNERRRSARGCTPAPLRPSPPCWNIEFQSHKHRSDKLGVLVLGVMHVWIDLCERFHKQNNTLINFQCIYIIFSFTVELNHNCVSHTCNVNVVTWRTASVSSPDERLHEEIKPQPPISFFRNPTSKQAVIF